MDLRRNNNMTIQSVSTKAKISKQYYSMLENGQRGKRLGFLIGVRIARSLGIGVDQFYENEEKYRKTINPIEGDEEDADGTV
jgi:transcriptional regulator with XRE-family HTH domain